MQESPTAPPRKSAYVALGANIPSPVGPPLETLPAAIAAIDASGMPVLRTSRYYHTPCVPAGHAPDFVNAVIELNTGDRTPDDVLQLLHEIENGFARERRRRWDARTLDLDLLALGDAVLPDAERQSFWRDLPFDAQMKRAPETLILPHPRLQDRGFVLIPFAEIAPDWTHPVTGKTVSQMRDALPEAEKRDIRPL